MNSPPTADDSPVHEALQEMEAEFAQLEPQYRAMGARLTNLRRAIISLRELLGLDVPDELRSSTVSRSSGARAASNEGDIRSAAEAQRVARMRADEAARAAMLAREAAAEAAALEAVATAEREPTEAAAAEPSSTDRVIELVKEQNGSPITRRDIYEQFERRGWMETSWRDAEATVRAAIRRAERFNEVERISPDSWRYQRTGHAEPSDGAA